MVATSGRSGERPAKETANRIFSGLAASYDRILDWTTLLQDRYWKVWLISKAALGRSDRILDIGCGTCILEEGLEETNPVVVGLDLTPEMLSFALSKRLNCVRGLVNGDAEALPFQDSAFDIVISCYVAKYCDLERFVAEAARVLRPGGRLLMYDFARPKGPALPFLALYTYGLLRLAGWLLSPVDRGVAYTFRELPRVISGSTWNEKASACLTRNRINVVERKALSGGVVEAIVARKATAGTLVSSQPLDNLASGR